MPAAMVHGGGGVLLIMTAKLASQESNNRKNTKLQMNAINAPSLTTISNSKQQNKITSKKQPRQQTPCSIKETYSRPNYY